MPTLASFVQSYIPRELRHTRDFTGPRGWVDLCNELLMQLASKGLFESTQKMEVGVEVSNYRWITLPADCRYPLKIYDPTDPDVTFSWETVNGKLKLFTDVDKDASPSSFTLSVPAAGSIKINDADATENQWADFLLVPTNGSVLRSILIASNAAASAGLSTLSFLHAQSVVPDATAGYLTDQYLMLEHMASYTGVTASSDEIPVDNRYEIVLKYGFCKLSCKVNSDEFIMYDKLHKEAMSDIEAEVFTPAKDQVRPKARSMPGLEDCDEYSGKSEYIGDNA